MIFVVVIFTVFMSGFIVDMYNVEGLQAAIAILASASVSWVLTLLTILVSEEDSEDE